MAELNADNWLTEDLFYENIGNAFTIFQCRDKRWIKEFWNYNLLLDYIRELHWIKEKKIILIIKNLSNCYISEKINKDEIINMFTNYVFLFWKNYNSKLIEPKYFHPKEIFVYYT
jgi:hypothetical protein